jgi:hypothetical protein
MAKEAVNIKTDESLVIKELKEIIRQKDQIIETLSKQVDTLLVKDVKDELVEEEKKDIKLIQINTKSGKKYFCRNPQEQEVFNQNNPQAATETFNIEMPPYLAEQYLNNPDNRKQFERKTA